MEDRKPLTIEHINVSELTLFEGNARRGDVDRIAESLVTNGQYKPIVVNRGTLTGRPNEVLAGNHTLMAAMSLGWVFIDAVFVDVDREAALRIVLADNQTADLARNDDAALIALLNEVPDLMGTGFSQADVAELIALMELGDMEDFEASAPPPTPTRYEIVVECEDEEEQVHLFSNLRSEGLRVRMVSM